MAKLIRRGFDFSPEGIARLCSDLSVPVRLAVLNKLDLGWNETEPFEVEIEIPLDWHPHTHVLTVAVDTTTQQVTIERGVGNECFASCSRCCLAVR
uniref:Uncharacterized protein n=1 Tax=Siphoviridae sp. ctLfk13 TaxID=2826251 RepID=A0A8S5N1E3_9CAUD|nr:MAG TPA: hypothetical protein [Siphoviridae sp. ctLfk13]